MPLSRSGIWTTRWPGTTTCSVGSIAQPGALFAAVGYGRADQTKPFDETDWTNLADPKVLPYMKSKTIAEKAAWDFIAK